MVFSSLPSLFLDPPTWPQQQPTGGSGGDYDLSQLPPPPPPVGDMGTGRPGSMFERARLAKLPHPEVAMKCPRCESTNTKFCYFNNYSLSQPRHFCKTCRRYWTRGGALRNVPVGGGCRRNKRSSKGSKSKTSRSKSPVNTPISSPSGHFGQPSQFPLLPPLHQLGNHFGGLTYGGGNGIDLIQLGQSQSQSNYPSSKFAQFPFMEEATNRRGYGFEGGEGPSNYGEGAIGGLFDSKQHLGLNLSRNLMGISGNEQFSGTSNVAWSTTDLNGLISTSSTTTTTTIL